MLFLLKYLEFNHPAFIEDLVPQLSNPVNTYRFSMLFMTIDIQEKICDESGQDLDHQAVLASCDEMVYFEMSLPPCEELLNIPTQLINEGNLFGGQIKAVCGNPVLFVFDLVPDRPQGFFSLINSLFPKKDSGIVKHDAVG